MDDYQYTPIELVVVPDEPIDDPRLLDVVKEYQAELERGGRPDRAKYLARHPDLSDQIARYLNGLDLLHLGARAFSAPRRPAPLDTGLAPGDRLGEFEIVREVGRGGMGIVYEADQPALKRRVALKVLPAAFAADRKRLQRFTVEAQAAAAAAHPHIVPVYGVGEDRGISYYVMKLIDGSALDTLAAGPATITDSGPADGIVSPANQLVGLSCLDRPAYRRAVARLGAAAARALDHAHQLGIVHRDVKPGNLLLDRTGHVWVTDFGLAQFAGGPSVTRSGGAVGTLRYMSPEQAAGDPRRLDHRTDVYSLAATLYELVVGRPVFDADEPLALARQIENADPVAPRAVDPAVPADLETVLLKALQKDPADRYETAAEFADDLDRFLAGKPVRARRPSIRDRARRWAGRHPTVVAAVGAALVVVALGSGVTTALVAAEQAEARRAERAERARADEAERRFLQAKALNDRMLRITEEEIGAQSPYQRTRRRLLLAALDNYRDLQAAGHGDPAVRAEIDRELARVEALLAEQAARRDAGRAHLLWYPGVRGDLRMTPDQIGQLIALPAPQSWRLDPATREAAVKILTPEQRHRLKQIDLQLQGPVAFNDPDVIEELALTATQRQQIRHIQAEAFAPGEEPPRPNAGSRVTRQILDVLTPQQRTAWHNLIGPRFGFRR